MSVSVLYMSMSLDGYIAGPHDEPGNPGGDGFMRLHEWYGADFRPSGPAGQLVDEENATGAMSRVGGPWSRSITGAVSITVSASSCPVTGHPVPRSPPIRW